MHASVGVSFIRCACVLSFLHPTGCHTCVYLHVDEVDDALPGVLRLQVRLQLLQLHLRKKEGRGGEGLGELCVRVCVGWVGGWGRGLGFDLYISVGGWMDGGVERLGGGSPPKNARNVYTFNYLLLLAVVALLPLPHPLPLRRELLQLRAGLC